MDEPILLIEKDQGVATVTLNCPKAMNALSLALRAALVNAFAALETDGETGVFELALACDVLVASTEARFADTHARVGIVPGWGLSQKLSRTIGIYRAKELSLTGNYLSAAQAADWGLVNRVVPPATRQDFS